MNLKSPRNQKKLYLVNRDFQLRYAGAAALVGVLSTALTTTLILVPLYQFEILRIPRFLPWPVLLMMLSAAFVNVALVGLMAIHVTHRLAGPMFSLTRQMRRVEEGQWFGSFKLRDGDELRYVARNFNEMLASIHRRAEEDLAIVQAVQQGIKEQSALNKVEQQLQDLAVSLETRLGLENQAGDKTC
ncbi:MAG: HAMP domain-containing protein [Oligoflexus sp.]